MPLLHVTKQWPKFVLVFIRTDIIIGFSFARESVSLYIL